MKNYIGTENTDNRGDKYKNTADELKYSMSNFWSVTVENSNNIKSTEHHDAIDKSRRNPYLHKFSVIGDLLIGFGIIIVGAMQLVVIYRQTSILASQASIMEDQNSITRGIQRAFITVNDLRQEPATDQNGKTVGWRFTPAISNSGNTPAEKMKIFFVTPKTQKMAYSYSIAARDIPGGIIDNRISEEQISWKVGAPLENLAIGANATVFPFFAGADISDQDAIAAQSGGIGRFFFGYIDYIDVFEHHHMTKYCFRIDNYIVRYGMQQSAPSYCRHWNCTDEACDADKIAYERDRAAAEQELVREHHRVPPEQPRPR